MLLAYAIWRSLRPIRFGDQTGAFLAILLEVGLHTLVVANTGYWASPYVFSLLTAITIAGFARGFDFAVLIALVSTAAVAIPFHFDTEQPARAALRTTAQWGVEAVLVAAVAGYARRLSGEAEARHTLALDRLGRLTEANNLLYSLHQLAQTLPASLDLEEVLDSTVARLRTLIDVVAVAIFIPDETSHRWLVARQVGTRLPPVLEANVLPEPVQEAIRRRTTIALGSIDLADGRGMSVRSHSGVYAPMDARGALVGVVALEHDEEQHFSPRDQELLVGFIESVALAIDNARWFQRLRTVSADEERTRIARDLHDRVGQSLAYLAFELERLEKLADDDALKGHLGQLRQDLRTVVGEVRETLYDLRTDVSETEDLPATIDAYVSRVRQRSRITVLTTYDAPHRLPLPQEREMWRIAQEAITNAERHGEPSLIRITWHCDARTAGLVIADNGRGFERGRAGRMDSYGMLGMRERAASIGARFDVESAPGEGTTVTCTLRRL